MNFEIDKKASSILLAIKQIPIVVFFGFMFFLLIPGSSLSASAGVNGLLMVFVLPILILICIYLVFVAPWLCNLQANKLEYILEKEVLMVRRGLFLKEVSLIPVEKITDLVMVQGPIESFFGVWSLKVQTAGMGQRTPEVLLLCLKHAEATKNEILKSIKGR